MPSNVKFTITKKYSQEKRKTNSLKYNPPKSKLPTPCCRQSFYQRIKRLPFIINHHDLTYDDLAFAGEYLVDLLDNIIVTHRLHQRFPELRNSIDALVEFVSTRKRPAEYEDRPSLLITFLFGLTALFHARDIYATFQKYFTKKINLQTAYCALPDNE